jgi:mono/diheme cytochrome c family protein
VEVPIRVLLHGLRGKIDVQGRSYDGVMPAFGSRLRDEEIAAILSYVRASWGNRAGSVAAKKVRALRNQFAARTQPWRAEELEAPEP